MPPSARGESAATIVGCGAVLDNVGPVNRETRRFTLAGAGERQIPPVSPAVRTR